MSPVDRRVLQVLQALFLLLPLGLGGRHPLVVAIGAAAVLGLLAVAALARARSEQLPRATGVAALGAFLALALATTVPLPPALLEVLSPRVAEIYRETLPGWPGAGGWHAWRPLALHAFGVWWNLSALAVGMGAFTVLIAHPWGALGDPDEARREVRGTLILTIVAGGAGLSLLALVQQVAGNGLVLWALDPVANPERASGSFVNPNHLALWLEMAIPPGLAYLGAVAVRLGRRVARAAASSIAIGIKPRRAWASALASNQGRLWLPLLVAAAIALMVVAHVATGSRGGSAGLLVGLAVASGAIGTRAPRRGLGRRGHGLEDESARPAQSWLARGAAAVFVVLCLVVVIGWVRMEEADLAQESPGAGEVSLTSRLAVATQGRAVVAEYPLFGTGLGSWIHAFRPHQAPPIEYGIWEHAHNEYLELVAETGLLGAAVVLWFAVVAFRATSGRARPRGADSAEAPASRRERLPSGFEIAEWRAAFGESTWLTRGLAGGVAAALVHALVDFGHRLPGNSLLFLVVVALLLLGSVREPEPGIEPSHPSMWDRWAAPAMLVLLSLALLPVAVDRSIGASGGLILSTSGLLAASDKALAEEGDRGQAIALAGWAVELSPADRETHEALASALGPGRESELALRRAIALQPSATQVRDRLASELWATGRKDAALTELEESMARYPWVGSHLYPQPAATRENGATEDFLRELRGGATLRASLEGLDDEVALAVERGLRQALEARPAGSDRRDVVEGLVLLLEAQERFGEAAQELRAEAGPGADDAPLLARAANDFLLAGDPRGAEEALVAALQLAPDRGDLYRTLAVEVFAARGDFGAAERILRAAQQNSRDMLPVYRGLTRVLSMRESARLAAAAVVPARDVAELDDAEPAPEPATVADAAPWSSANVAARVVLP